jgi:uncharacterized protein YjbI with pentapeptide repeats
MRASHALALVATLGVLGGSVGDPGPRPSKPPRAIRVEIALVAHEARWRPKTNLLVLRRVAPRMMVMTVAPKRRAAVLPASMLRANWRRLFADVGGHANVVLSATHGGRRVLVPLRARLTRGHASGDRMAFEVRRLKHSAHTPDRLPARRVVLTDPTLVVDPTVTDAIKAMWQALVSFFSGESFGVPPNPAYENADGRVIFDDGDGIYNGPDSAEIQTPDDWIAAQREVLDASGQYIAGPGGVGNENPFADITFRGLSYDGLAVFSGPFDFNVIAFSPQDGPRVAIENSAIFWINARSLQFHEADVGGVNMRGTSAGSFTAENSVFQDVDMTGARLGGGDGVPRSHVENSVFVDVVADRAAEDPDDRRDPFTGEGLELTSIDFESVSFQDSSFGGASVSDATFQGCGFQNVDFTGATITGVDPGEGGTFQPTFDNSIMEGVRFDDARFENVSFAGVDFSGGDVSLDGARLSNVDFTGAVGLQFIDWTSVTVEGNVYGLAQYSQDLGEIQNRDWVRSITFDGQIPEIDVDTGLDIEPDTGYLIDTGTGVRLEKGPPGQGLIPIDPNTGEPMRNPENGNPLVFEPGGVFDPATNERFDVDYGSGELRGER